MAGPVRRIRRPARTPVNRRAVPFEQLFAYAGARVVEK
ncbi:hypothetical protein YT1_2550 [Rhodococcus ruber]|nr:hypothetical protein YT1_2550 [Rhodococcus ruber]